MRPRYQTPRDQLAPVLSRRSALSANDLAGQLGVSVATLHRLLQEQGAAIVAAGKARRSRYALRRSLRGELGDLPVYAVDATGQAAHIADLALVRPQGSLMNLANTGWPVPEAARDGWWAGLPYPMADMRPQGYLGRQLARAVHGSLSVAADPNEWNDDDVVHVLSRLGHDTSGNLILGNPSFEHWQARKLEAPAPLSPRATAAAYARLAEQAIAAGVQGSSAAGEFPKFPAVRDLAGAETSQVLVKFSGADGSPTVQRWADLLVCEHLALVCAAALPGVSSARSRVLQHGGRTFLEVERFDRHGSFGRSPLVSLGTLNAEWLGAGTADWPQLAERMLGLGVLDASALLSIEHLWWFGRLIANTDMHTGNLSFRPGPNGFSIAPVYDMLPMLYAPLPGGEVPARDFKPPQPLPQKRATWLAAYAAAIEFWRLAAKDARISVAFRATCAGNAAALQRVRELT